MNLAKTYSEKYLIDKINKFGAETLTEQELLDTVLSVKLAKTFTKQVIRTYFSEHKTVGDLKYMNNDDLLRIFKTPDRLAIVKAMREFSNRYKKSDNVILGQVLSSELVGRYLVEKIGNYKQEVLVCLCLDTKNQILNEKIIFKGTLNSATVHPREIFKHALNYSCARILVVHNHPSGNVQPSQNDLNLTKRLIAAGKIIGIEVIDHIIVGKESYLSLAEERIVEFWGTIC